MPALEAFVRRMIGHPEDTRDLVQDTLVRAYEAIDGFRGEASVQDVALLHRHASLPSIICAPAAAGRGTAQEDGAEAALRRARQRRRAHQLLGGAAYRFDAREHIAFCFTCVGRSLDRRGAGGAGPLRGVPSSATASGARARALGVDLPPSAGGGARVRCTSASRGCAGSSTSAASASSARGCAAGGRGAARPRAARARRRRRRAPTTSDGCGWPSCAKATSTPASCSRFTIGCGARSSATRPRRNPSNPRRLADSPGSRVEVAERKDSCPICI